MEIQEIASADLRSQAVQALQPVEERGHLVGPAGNTYVAHCHHYNCFLQKTLRSRPGLNMDAVLVEVAALLFFAAFRSAFDETWSLERRLAYAEAFFRVRGYGNPRMSDAASADKITADSSHYSEGYRSKYGLQDTPQDFLLTGALQGALMAAHGYDVEVKQQNCLAMGDFRNVWAVERKADQTKKVARYVNGVQQLSDNQEALTALPKPDELPAPAISEAVADMGLAGDPEKGLIPAFNVQLSFIPSLYYNICSQIFRRRIGKNEMSRALGRRLLKEAGHICGFYTLGNILLSPEYALLRETHFGDDPTAEDSMTALFGVVNAFGWGYWTLDAFAKEDLRFSVHNSYEAYNYREYFGEAKAPVDMLHPGGGEAIMNAVRYGDILNFEGSIDESYVDRVFEKGDGFVAEEEQCYAMGEAGRTPCRFHVFQ